MLGAARSRRGQLRCRSSTWRVPPPKLGCCPSVRRLLVFSLMRNAAAMAGLGADCEVADQQGTRRET